MSNKIFLYFTLLFVILSCSKKDTQPAKSSSKSIIIFTFNSFNIPVRASIDSVQKTISITLPVGSDASKLAPIIIISNKATISPASGVIQDFTKPVIYSVTAEDGTIANYTVNVTVTKSSEKSIKSFIISNLTPNVTAKIDSINKIVIASIPVGSDLTKLTTKITVSDRASINPPSGLQQDFSKQVNYIVTAEDGTSQNYETLIIEDIKSNCGNNKANIFIDGIEYCSTYQECSASLNTKSNCGNDGISKKLLFWFAFRGLKIDNIPLSETSFIGRITNVTKQGKYLLDANSQFYTYELNNVIGTSEIELLKDGTVFITELSTNLFTATFILRINYKGKEKILKGKLENIRLDIN